jgi:hypothetical protein
MTTFESLTALSPEDVNQPPHAVTWAVLEYSCELADSDPDRALAVLRLASGLRQNAHEINSDEAAASPEMDALLNPHILLRSIWLVDETAFV